MPQNKNKTKQKRIKKKPCKIMVNANLLKMFGLNRNDKKGIKKFDVDALIREVQQNPPSIEQKKFVNDKQDPRFVEPRSGKGGCRTCGRQCFRKSLYGRIRCCESDVFFQSIPITDGLVHEGRCLRCRPFEPCFPLHQAIVLRLPLNAIDALSCPIALTEKCNRLTALHLAQSVASTEDHDASWEVVKLLLEKQPKSAREKYSNGKTSLHVLIEEAPLDVLSLLLRSWPDAAKEKDDNGQTMLHYACANETLLKKNRWWTFLQIKKVLDVISLLLGSWPDAIKERDRFGRTPLYYACDATRVVPLKAIILLLDKWLEDKENRNSSELDSMKSQASAEVRDLLCHVSSLLSNEVFDPPSNGSKAYFINIELWNGVFLVINKHPTITKGFNLRMNVMPKFLSRVGERCSLRTMWKVIIDERELLQGAE